MTILLWLGGLLVALEVIAKVGDNIAASNAREREAAARKAAPLKRWHR